jgi:hypothetical protein
MEVGMKNATHRARRRGRYEIRIDAPAAALVEPESASSARPEWAVGQCAAA